MEIYNSELSLFYELPEHLYHCICQEWIETIDLVRLDIATASSIKYRQTLRALFKENNFCTNGFSEHMETDCLEWLTKRNISVQNLSLQDSSFLSWFNNLEEKFLHLERLAIDNLSVANHPKIFHLTFSLPKLRELSLKCCYNFADVLSDSDGNIFIPQSQSIIKIDFQGSSLGEQHMIFLLERLPKLESVGYSSCPSFSQLAADHMMIFCPHIHSMSLSYLENLNDTILSALLGHYIQLQFLDVSFCCNLTELSLVEIIQHPNMIGLRIAGIRDISDMCIREVLTKLNGLNVLDISEVSVSIPTFLHFAPSCCNLRELSLNNCLSIDDVLLIRIAECAGESLENLDLTYCYKITDAGIISLAKCCQRLREINLSFCLLVSDFGIENMARSCCDLISLSLAGINQLTDNCLIVLAEDLLLLEELNISGCTLITDTSFIGLLLACRQLRRLDISDNNMISSLSIQRLMQLDSCRRMRYLNLSYCLNIDEGTVLQLRRDFPKMFVHYNRPNKNYFNFDDVI
jgi:hypothetical protein